MWVEKSVVCTSMNTKKGCALCPARLKFTPPAAFKPSCFQVASCAFFIVIDCQKAVPQMVTNTIPPEGVQSGLPQDPSEFDADPRVSWSRVDEKFILETDEGNEFEWDTALKRWIPVVGYNSQT